MSNILNYNGYIGSVEYSSEDRIFFGKVELVTDVVTFEGSTPDELENSFREAVDGYIELCKEVGKEPQKAFKGTFNVRINPELHKKAAMVAIQKHTTLNQVVAEAISKYVAAN
jgi:predicted HicB family RNase H-like nuclease